MQKLRTVVLSGELGRKFGRRHSFAISTPAEAIKALCANYPGFEKHVLDSGSRGVGYRVLVNDQDTKLDQLHAPMGRAEIRIVPVIGGAKNGIWQVLAGVAMIAASFVPGLNVAVWAGASMTWSSVAFSVGVSLALGGVTQMLAPHPKTPQTAQSYTLNGPVNTTAQGAPVPIGYGRMIVGSAVISAGVTIDQVPTTETGPSNLTAVVSENNGAYSIYVSWGAAGEAVGYDVFISGVTPNPLPRTNGTSVIWTVPHAGPYAVTVKSVEQDGSYGPSVSCTSGTADTPGTTGNPSNGNIVIGFKGSGGSGNSGKIDPDTLASRAYAQFVDLVCEGEVEGLANGLQSVYFGGTPLMNANGTYNFSGLSIATNSGTPDQAYIPGFSDVENGEGVGVTVTQNAPIVRTITSPNVDAVRVIISVPQLSSTSLKNGEVSGTSFSLAIDVQASGGDYVEYIYDTVSGKVSNTYQRAYRIDLPGAGPWNIRLRRITPDNLEANISNAFSWDSYVEIIDAKLSYPNSALVALRVDSAQFQSVPTRGYDMKLLRVQVPSNYDPIARTYTGAWDGTFKVAWTDNPAWCWYDILTANRYGLGNYINASQIDKWALYQIAQYCDQLVPDGFGGQEPRFTCNLYLQNAASAFQVLQDMASIFRGMAYWGSGNVTAVQDAPKDPVALFTAANVVDGAFSYSGSSLKARHTAALVTWSDPDNMYKGNVEFVPDDDGIARYGLVTTSITALGCTSRGQAHRAGRWLLYSERLETEAVAFSSGLDGTPVRPGDVIKVADPTRAGQRLGGRISASTANTVTIDSPLVDGSGNPVNPVGATLSVVTMSGVLATGTISEVDGRVLTLAANLPSLPQYAAMWIVELATVEAQLFRVISVKEQEATKGVYDVTALAHNPSKYGYIEENLTLETRSITSLTATPSPPASVAIEQHLYTYQSSVFVQATFSWPAVPAAIGYQVAYQVSGGNWTTVTTSSAEFDIMQASAGDYVVRVWTIGANGTLSALYTEGSETLPGMNQTPGDVTGFQATLDGSNCVLTWTPNADLNLAGYELRRGTVWASGSVLIENYHGTSFTVPVSVAGEYDFMARALNTSGYYSPDDATASITLTAAQVLANNTSQNTDAVGGRTATQVNDDLDTAKTAAQQALTATEQEVADRVAAVNAAVAQLNAQMSAVSAVVATMSGEAPVYDASVAYKDGSIVKDGNGVLYAAIQDVPAGDGPPNATYWEWIGAYGSVGDALSGLAVSNATLSAQVTNLNGSLTAEIQQNQNLYAQITGGYTGTDPTALTSGLLANIRTAQITADTANTNAINGVSASLADLSGTVQGQANTITQLQASVTAANGSTTSNTQAITALTAKLGNPNPNLLYNSTFSMGSLGWTANTDQYSFNEGFGDIGYFADTTTNSAYITSKPISIFPGGTYTVSGIIGGGGGASNWNPPPYFGVQFFASDNSTLLLEVNTYGVAPTNTQGYQHVQASGVAPANAVYARVFCWANTSLNGNYVAFSRLKLELGGTATAWSDDATFGPAVAANSQAVQSLQATASNISGQVTANANAITNLQGEIDATNGNAAATSQALNNLSISVSNINGQVQTNAESITQLSNSIGGYNATIQNIQTVQGQQSGNITTLLARASMLIDNDGVLSGWENNNDGSQSPFKVYSSDFQIVDTSNPGNPITVFDLSGGVAKMHAIEVDTIKVDSVATGALATNAALVPVVATFSGGGYSNTNLISASINMDYGGLLMFDFGVALSVNGTGDGPNFQIMVYVDNNLYAPGNRQTFQYVSGLGTSGIVPVGAGNHTVRIWWYNGDYPNTTISSGQLSLVGVKKVG